MLCGLARSRWWLAGLRQVIPWWTTCALSTLSTTLRRWKVFYRRGRRYVHSPDLEYASKVQRMATITWYSRQRPQAIVRLYQDELTYYRRASVAHDYVPAGEEGPRAQQGWGRNTRRRIAGCLDPTDGRFFAWQRAAFDRRTFLRFLQAVEEQYPQAEQIFLILDNWPVHFHPEVLEGIRGSKLQLVRLPTYAPWLNPVEKVWRKLYAEVLHLHAWVDHWDQLQAAVQRWLDQYADGSTSLLRYVGFCPD